MEVAIMLYNGITALDALGPYEVFAAVTGSKVKFVAKDKGLIKLDSKMGYLHADYSFSEVNSADILVVPGCSPPNYKTPMNDENTLNWIRQIHETTKWTTSVCTGSLILSAAGLLHGVKATSHWSSFDLLHSLGAIPTDERVVRQGKIVTAAGVSSGIDMALQLVAWESGEDMSKAVQLILEYDPMPPFDSGSPKKAPAPMVEQLRGMLQELEKQEPDL
ncbi:DJ-1/PfpI family protein [Brevibacillus laterosporus]|uniref:DJ-1/PfpI family protein n=1 Tax=Brevibacillus laterosporus TaxID=1465 RepID=UPI000CE49795|nr:DJ-1/PfpI family protein [Brevibacillus laterosporus]MED1663896.1 DJ-1/PfpI family protein [Brevibacillus laterosporus]MED1669326.1 DJ-1/PfpI family protein [Brevibacillus laterosporus]MED1719514.1 DJ-1/PfpI family protein [Brevibacillus laterosporus]PPA88715.1 4-methyl-5(B-hydroxyethyl)-thiazole monophosphate biosynthesis protein [Brevibacillus laterosporus]